MEPSSQELKSLPKILPVQEDDFLADDPVRQYLREIGHVPMLSREEEEQLSATIQAGRPLNATQKAKDAANDAAQRMVEANLRLVVSVAKKYSSQSVSILDRIQEGNIGLIKAVWGFDASRGFRFSTYATWWIKQGVTQALNDARIIRVSSNMRDRARKLTRIQRALQQQLECEPTIDEILTVYMSDLRDQFKANTKRAPKEERDVEAWARPKNLWLTTSDVIDALHLPDTISWETPVGDEDELGSFIEAPVIDDPAVSGEEIAKILAILPAVDKKDGPMMAKIIRARLGLLPGGEPPMKLREVGIQTGKTRERIRQLEEKALNILGSRYGVKVKQLIGEE